MVQTAEQCRAEARRLEERAQNVINENVRSKLLEAAHRWMQLADANDRVSGPPVCCTRLPIVCAHNLLQSTPFARASRFPSGLSAAGCSVPIYPLLENSGFGPEQTKTMGEAFEDALVRLGLTDRTDPLTELVAKKVIEIGQQGERDPKRITDLTVMAFTA